ncbi:MAG: UDP-N-acetylmuramoyl-L-alanyl-D-glutamate--2,6-diaminopimelate ligase 1 [Patescibacteria group bacterium]|nr:UDP-N-acetylmuramoyl-L-alanyl-D-glutamate--2,6-diaminopimelate ligase 1 [Patescibacteria group bacterium]
MRTIINLLRRILPAWVFQLQHYLEARASQLIFKNPSNKMIVIGIVGSKGKTTVANILWGILDSKNSPTGLIGTADIKIGSKTIKNHWHKTMPGRWYTQQLLSKMQKAGCKYAILEVPSEAQQNWRHIGINFDTIIFTNVTNEILAVHKNNLELLHKHNKRLLSKLSSLKRKRINGSKIPKTIIANKDSKYFTDYSAFKADKKISYSTESIDSDLVPTNIKSGLKGSSFKLAGQNFELHIPGYINVSNAAAAIATAKTLGLNLDYIAKRLDQYKGVPGRMNLIDSSQPFTVLIDYAHEESGLQYLMEWAKACAPKGSKIVSLICGQGGGRDVKKRPIMGEIAAKYSDSVIVSNDDVYDDDPQEIIRDIINGCKKVRPTLKGIYNIEDRREGIAKALSLANRNDLVLITGKGVDTSMIIAGKKIPWNEHQVVLEELTKLGYK